MLFGTKDHHPNRGSIATTCRASAFSRQYSSTCSEATRIHQSDLLMPPKAYLKRLQALQRPSHFCWIFEHEINKIQKIKSRPKKELPTTVYFSMAWSGSMDKVRPVPRSWIRICPHGDGSHGSKMVKTPMESPGWKSWWFWILKKPQHMVWFTGIDGHMFPVQKTRSSQVLWTLWK